MREDGEPQELSGTQGFGELRTLKYQSKPKHGGSGSQEIRKQF